MEKLFIVLICLGLLLPKNASPAISPKKQVKIILYTGLYGAVLGLSTLSFYNKPGEHARNIAIGGALGLIASVAISTVLATKEDKQRIQTELINKGTNVQDAKANKVDPNKINKKKSDTNNKTTNEIKNDTNDYYDSDMDDYEDEEEDEDEYEDEKILNNNNTRSIKLFFTEFSNNNVFINPDFMVFYENPNSKKINIYAKLIDYRF